MEEECTGDIIRMDRLVEFFSADCEGWDDSGEITLNDITDAIFEGISEVPDPYGDTWSHPVMEHRTRDWHIGRVIYFINHPTEIEGIYLDNFCDKDMIYPRPIIVDGNHRFLAARWLYERGELSKIHCRYGGRLDILEYLQGKIDDFDREII